MHSAISGNATVLPMCNRDGVAQVVVLAMPPQRSNTILLDCLVGLRASDDRNERNVDTPADGGSLLVVSSAVALTVVTGLCFTVWQEDISDFLFEQSMSPSAAWGAGPQTLFGWEVVSQCLRKHAPTPVGVDTSGLLQHQRPTPRAWQVFEEDGRRTQVWRGPGGEGEELWDMLRPRLDTLPDHFLRAANFHIGVHPQHPPLRLLRELRQLAHAAGGVLSVETYTGCEGPASPQQLQASGAAASPLSPHTAALACGLQALLSSCDLFSPNELEAASLLGPAPPGQMATELLARAGPTGAGLVVVRCGAQGVVAASRALPGQLVEVPAVPDTQVEDVTGAGNAFCGGLLAALHHMRCAPWLCGVTAARLEQEPGHSRPSPAAASPPPLLADLVVGGRAAASGGDSGASQGHGGRASGASGASTLPSPWSVCDSSRPGLQGAGAALRQAAVWGVAAASLVVEVPGLPQPPLARLQQRVQGRVDAMRRQLGLPLQACRQPQGARLTGYARAGRAMAQAAVRPHCYW
ncbi:hypothetical protein QJQ45_008155 [Haematococcus lacustris]|nr:hypothetical protein QJQ45_008155 [Haematococcus lacustris]